MEIRLPLLPTRTEVAAIPDQLLGHLARGMSLSYPNVPEHERDLITLTCAHLAQKLAEGRLLQCSTGLAPN